MNLNGPQNFSAALLFAATLCFPAVVFGNETEWMKVDRFLSEAFSEQDQKPEILWITPEIRDRLESTLNRKYPGIRIRYWANSDRSAWILEQIGKERPITAGFIVEDSKVVSTHVLIYRESRGGEIRYQSFRDQFIDVQLSEGKLDKHIDGITGATLSVTSMKQMAEAALILHAQSKSGLDVAAD